MLSRRAGLSATAGFSCICCKRQKTLTVILLRHTIWCPQTKKYDQQGLPVFAHDDPTNK